MHTNDILYIDIKDSIFDISIDGAMASQDISEKISSISNGNWKKIVSMEYNSITGQLRINYEA
jgi:hypothetical protein